MDKFDPTKVRPANLENPMDRLMGLFIKKLELCFRDLAIETKLAEIPDNILNRSHFALSVAANFSAIIVHLTSQLITMDDAKKIFNHVHNTCLEDPNFLKDSNGYIETIMNLHKSKEPING